jgi:hypothetical protein
VSAAFRLGRRARRRDDAAAAFGGRWEVAPLHPACKCRWGRVLEAIPCRLSREMRGDRLRV